MAVERRDDLDAGDHHRPVLDALGVLRSEPGTAAVGGADDERERHLTVGHVPALRDLVGDDVPAHREEVAEHDLGDRSQAGHGRTHRGAEDRLLGDRRVTDAVGFELLEESGRRLEHAAGTGDVLAEEHDVGVVGEFLREAEADRVSIRQFRHVQPPSAQTSV